jgi:pantetheine-phosphate adenylyltransferase
MIDFKDTINNYLQKPFEEQLEIEKLIFNQFQSFDFLFYREQRLKHLNKINANNQLDALIAYVKFREPKIGVFAGSFNPFHKGHYNVLQKAERIFDKVIIAFGKNPGKDDRYHARPNTIKNRQICEYEGLLTDFIETLKYDVTVVRGLRNSTDFQYEQNQYRYIQELKPDIKIISIFCNKEFEHISSSGIRTLEKYGKHQQYLLD